MSSYSFVEYIKRCLNEEKVKYKSPSGRLTKVFELDPMGKVKKEYSVGEDGSVEYTKGLVGQSKYYVASAMKRLGYKQV